jgi:hypothetical protein
MAAGCGPPPAMVILLYPGSGHVELPQLSFTAHMGPTSPRGRRRRPVFRSTVHRAYSQLAMRIA